jgi:hypothetical protein
MATALINHVDHVGATVHEIDPPSREPPLLKLRRAMGYSEMFRERAAREAEID